MASVDEFDWELKGSPGNAWWEHNLGDWCKATVTPVPGMAWAWQVMNEQSGVIIRHGDADTEEAAKQAAVGERRMRVVAVMEAVIVDPTWTGEDLTSNGVMYLESMVDDGQADNEGRHGPGAYHFDTSDLTLYLEPDYLADLAEFTNPEGTTT